MTESKDGKPGVTFFIPNSRWFGKLPRLSVPHGIAILVALLDSHCRLSLVDGNGADLDEATCCRRLRETRPDLVLMSAITAVEYTPQVHRGLALAREGCPEAVIILGGVYPTVSPGEALRDPNVDFIFLGHAEERILPFLERVLARDWEALRRLPGIGFRDQATGEPVINPVASFIGEVSRLVRPDYSLMDLEPYLREEIFVGNTSSRSPVPIAPILTSYGCPYNCSFCATRTISGRAVAFRPLEDVFAEIDDYVREYRVGGILFQDDNLFLKRERVERLCDEFIGGRWGDLPWKVGGAALWLMDAALIERMSRAGCRKLRVSVESGSPRVLREIIHKPVNLEKIPGIVRKCREVGILVRAQFVIGFPGETWEELRETFRFAESCDFDLVHFTIATPLPGTELYGKARESGALGEDFSFAETAYQGWGQAFLNTGEFTARELMILRAFEWDRINFKTPEKTALIARMYNMTVAQLNDHRRVTRQRIGVV
ncbi:MAG: radical SAM protein [Magnetococcales bacterium]|nr:radical SAM protein [Magnetococcales bacterium]